MGKPAIVALTAGMLLILCCAELVTSRFDMVYTPSAAKPASEPQSESRTKHKASICLRATTDIRSEKKYIGVFLDRFQKPSSYIVTNDDLSQWADGAIRQELENCGYMLVPETDIAQANYIVTAEIKELWCESSPTRGARSIVARVVIKYQTSGPGLIDTATTTVGEAFGRDDKFISRAELDMQLLSDALRQTVTQAINHLS